MREKLNMREPNEVNECKDRMIQHNNRPFNNHTHLIEVVHLYRLNSYLIVYSFNTFSSLQVEVVGL